MGGYMPRQIKIFVAHDGRSNKNVGGPLGGDKTGHILTFSPPGTTGSLGGTGWEDNGYRAPGYAFTGGVGGTGGTGGTGRTGRTGATGDTGGTGGSGS